MDLPGRVYARLGAVYAWASPSYIREHMTEPQVMSYLQSIDHVSEQMAKPSVFLLLEGIGEMLAAIFGKSPRR